jgi:hypothetical protein
VLKAAIGADTIDLQTADDAAAVAALKRDGYRFEAVAAGVRVFVEHGEAMSMRARAWHSRRR